MASIKDHIADIRQTLPEGVALVCVSKFQPLAALQEAYDAGERDFGESRVQELLAKHDALPGDIRWHFIGHLQTNKVRAIVPFVYLIQSVDSERLLATINAEAKHIGRRVNVLIEVHVAQEETKSGFSIADFQTLLQQDLRAVYPWVNICGLMCMATQTQEEQEIRRCFRTLKTLSTLGTLSTFGTPSTLGTSSTPILSIGMSSDYLLAIQEGSTMVRIGTTIFGERN